MISCAVKGATTSLPGGLAVREASSMEAQVKVKKTRGSAPRKAFWRGLHGDDENMEYR